MNKINEWSHLSNASHIDWVIDSLRIHSDIWENAWNITKLSEKSTWNFIRANAWNAARKQMSFSLRNVSWNAARITINIGNKVYSGDLRATYNASWGAVAALIAYDHSGEYFELSENQLRTWMSISDDPAAILMLPAIIAREQISKLEEA